MRKVGFAVSFMVAILGAVLLLISQVPLTREYYDMVETHTFSVGEPLTFYSTLEEDVRYRFEVEGMNWTSSTRYSYHLMVGNYTDLVGMPGPNYPPWVWYRSQDVTRTYNVTFYHYDFADASKEIERATTTSASVEISVLRETTYRLTYLIYVGLPLLIIGAILITITERNVDHTPKVSELSVGIELLSNQPKFNLGARYYAQPNAIIYFHS